MAKNSVHSKSSDDETILSTDDAILKKGATVVEEQPTQVEQLELDTGEEQVRVRQRFWEIWYVSRACMLGQILNSVQDTQRSSASAACWPSRIRGTRTSRKQCII